MLRGDAIRRVHLLAQAGKHEDENGNPIDPKDLDESSISAPGGPAVIIQSLDGTHGDRHRKSIAASDGMGSQGGISHSGTIVSRTMTDKISMLDGNDDIEKELVV